MTAAIIHSPKPPFVWDSILIQASQQPTTIMITANEYSAKCLLNYYLTSLASTQKTIPHIISWQNWLSSLMQQLWYQGFTKGLLLSKSQQYYIWQQVLSNPIQHNAIISDMQAALRVLAHRDIPLATFKTSHDPDQQFFYHHAKNYQNYCREFNYHDENTVLSTLISYLPKLHLPQQLLLIGFSEFTPLEQFFLTQLTAHGIFINFPTLPSSLSETGYYTYPDRDQEIAAMANWAFKTALTHYPLPIICSVPELSTQSSFIQYHFEKMANHYQYDRLYTICHGEKLHRFPMIKTLIQTLKLHFDSCEIQDCYEWLQSLYLIEASQEREARLNLIQRMQAEGYQSLTFQEFYSCLQKSHCTILQKITARITIKNSLDTIENWLAHFQHLLTLYLNLTAKTLSCLEQQLLQHWTEILDNIRSISALATTISASELVNWITKQTAETHFSLAGETSNLYILALEETITIPSYARWICQLSNQQRPMTATFNRLLPAHLQQQLTQTTATKTRQLWQQYTQNIIYSYTEDEITLAKPSQLLFDIPSIAQYFDYQQQYVKPIDSKSIWLEDTYGMPLTQSYVAEGVGILRTQAACPCKAYISHRLGIKPELTPRLGFNTIDKGSILHLLLEKFWLKHQTSSALQALSEQEIYDQLTNIYQQDIFKKFSQPEIFHQLELKRAVTIATKWLLQEQQRPDFTVIGLETTYHYSLHNIDFKLRLDRVDQLSNNQYLIIDYKTSKYPVSEAQWQTPRIDEPQLPLYALAYGENCHGIAFVHLTAKAQKMVGMGNNITTLGGIKAVNWSRYIENWLTDIHHLVEEFQQGYAAVAPKRSDTCKICQFHSICRIYHVK